MKITFTEVSISRTRKETCSVCGKKRQKTKKFLQTINPFNTDDQNRVKDRPTILQELQEKASSWLKEPHVCTACED